MASFPSLDGVSSHVTLQNALKLLALWLVYRFLLNLYNMSPLHPLYKFPGPRLAAASYGYEAWYDLIKGGKYTFKIKEMHAKYGPIIRINPDELHCDDYEFNDDIYPPSGNHIRDKSAHFLAAFSGTLKVSTFGTPDHETHRTRRSAINKFFSRAGIFRYEPEIHDMAQKMCTKFLRLTQSGQIVDALDPFNCFTADAISQYCFGESFGFLDREDFKKNYRPAWDHLIATLHIFRHFPILSYSADLMPMLGPYLGPDIAFLVKSMNETIPNLVAKAQQDQHVKGRRVFNEIMDSPIPEEHKTNYRLSGEGWSLLAAGTETTAGALTFITYFLLSQPEKLEKLREELKNEDPHKLSWVKLEKYPYLHGVIWESFRVSLGIPSRLPRIARDEELVYNGRGFNYVIPRGTTIGMSAYVNHYQADLFPDPEQYEPERWIDAQGNPNHAMEKYILSFGKGSRQCLGMNLALCELYLVTAAMALRVWPHLKLYDTAYEDIKYDFDALTPQPKKGSRGVRVTGI